MRFVYPALLLIFIACKSHQCPGFIPSEPALNFFPVSYDPNSICTDASLVDAVVIGAGGRRGRFALNQAEHDAGVEVQPGDKVMISIYFDNGGADLPQYTAKNVWALVDFSDTLSTMHRVRTQLVSDNTKPVSSITAGGDLILHSQFPTKIEYTLNSTTICARPNELSRRRLKPTGYCGKADQKTTLLDTKDAPRMIYIGNLIPGFAHSGTVEFIMNVRSK